VFRDRAEDTAKWGSSKADAAKFETRVSKGSKLQVWVRICHLIDLEKVLEIAL
jgi:hypothetical protein